MLQAGELCRGWTGRPESWQQEGCCGVWEGGSLAWVSSGGDGKEDMSVF